MRNEQIAFEPNNTLEYVSSINILQIRDRHDNINLARVRFDFQNPAFASDNS